MARDELDLEAVMGMRTIARSFGRVLLWGCAAICGAHAGERVVLPATVTPEHYRIDLVPDAGSLTFKATVAIDVTVHQTTNELALNSADIVIDSAALSGEARAPAIRHDEATETTTFALDHALKPGAYTLMLAYHGKIYQRASGLFALDYETPQGKARALFTQFENSDARRFVPSWDEPARKATFELTATVPADQTAISNMPVASTELLGDHLKRVHFATTPKMSSYLLYFGAGDFERVARKVGGVDVGVVVKRGDTLSAGFALDAALLQQLLRHPLSLAETRPDCRAGFEPVLRRHGKLGRNLLFRTRSADRCAPCHRGRQTARLHRGRA
jgi:aminopeptidase N